MTEKTTYYRVKKHDTLNKKVGVKISKTEDSRKAIIKVLFFPSSMTKRARVHADPEFEGETKTPSPGRRFSIFVTRLRELFDLFSHFFGALEELVLTPLRHS